MDHFSSALGVSAENEFKLKIMLIGESGAGKSSILQRFTKGSFTEQAQSTIGVDFQIKPVVISGKKVTLQIWDTAGQEKYFTITSSYYRQADGIVLVFDMSNPDGWTKISKWYDEVQRYAKASIPCILVGNKSDLAADVLESKFVVPVEPRRFAADNGMPFYETSARDGRNVDAALVSLCEASFARKLDDLQSAGPPTHLPPSSASTASVSSVSHASHGHSISRDPVVLSAESSAGNCAC